MAPAVVVRDLWEVFRVSEDRARSLKEVASRFRVSRGKTTFWGLKGVGFEIAQGETVGLVGENGSGKSTLLKCIAGILPATKGEVLLSGRVSSLIELGAGFHPELTGRENVMLNGALFGLTRQQIKDRFEEIVGFAEIEEFLDRPVRSYSSGMTVRLAFSLAIHVEPDILLIDEVLAVGDESFQRKSAQRVQDLHAKGVTIIFVSHDLSLVRRVCARSLLLHHGELVADGETDAIIERYLTLENLPAL